MVDVNVELKTGQGVSVTPTTRVSAITTIGRASVSPIISKTQGASISATQKEVSVEVGVGQTRDNYLSILKDVLLTNLLDNQLLKYNTVSGKWLNWTLVAPSAQIQSDWNQTNNALLDYIKNKPTIPTALSDLTDDATHRLVTDVEKGDWDSAYNAIHNAVTLDTNADDILSLTTQVIGLQTQIANTVLAGRATVGTALVPTFRALVALDIPDLSGTYLTSQISHADVVVDGDFSSQGIMIRGSSAGSYSILTDTSANWNTAYGWGNHASAGYYKSGDNALALAVDRPGRGISCY